MTTPLDLTDAELQEAQKLCDEATPGPWHRVDQPWGDGSWVTASRTPDPHGGRAVCDCEMHEDYEEGDEMPVDANAAFIAAARSLVPRLLASLRATRARLGEVEAAQARYRESTERRYQDEYAHVRGELTKARALAAEYKANAETAMAMCETVNEQCKVALDQRDSLRAQFDAWRPVVEASIEMRRVESTDVLGESIAELEANVPAAQRRTAGALMRWRNAVDALAAPSTKDGAA